MKSQIILFFALVMLGACNNPTKSGITQQPTLADYQVGEKWVWKYKGVTTEGEVRSDGEDTREIVSVDGVLGMTIGNDTIPVTDIVKPDESKHLSTTGRCKWVKSGNMRTIGQVKMVQREPKVKMLKYYHTKKKR